MGGPHLYKKNKLASSTFYPEFLINMAIELVSRGGGVMCGVPCASKIAIKMHKMPMGRKERVQKENTETVKILRDIQNPDICNVHFLMALMLRTL